MRIQEILELTLQDINFDSNPVKVTVKAGTSKNRKSRITFISNEAHEALKEWLKVRSKYLQTAQKRAANKTYDINVNDERIFPIDYLTARLWWCRLLHEATDKENNLAEKDTTFEFQRTHYKRHIHTLRKYFRTNLPDEEKASTDVVETLMGHEGYLTKEYRRVPEPRLMKEYMNAVGNVTIFGIDESIVEDKDRQIATLKQQMETLKNDIVNQVINTLKSGQPQLIKELMKQTPTAKVFMDGSTEL